MLIWVFVKVVVGLSGFPTLKLKIWVTLFRGTEEHLHFSNPSLRVVFIFQVRAGMDLTDLLLRNSDESPFSHSSQPWNITIHDVSTEVVTLSHPQIHWISFEKKENDKSVCRVWPVFSTRVKSCWAESLELMCSFTVSLCSPAWRRQMSSVLRFLSALVCWNMIIWLGWRGDVYVPSSPTDPESWGKHRRWLPGRPAGWEHLLLGCGIPPVVAMHHRQRHQRGPADRPHREAPPGLLHCFSSLWHKILPSASASGESSSTGWKETLRFHRSG